MLNHFKNFTAYAALMTVLVLGYVAASPDAHAGSSCNQNDVRIDGNNFAGDPFSVPARIGGPAPNPNIGLSAQDCTTDRFQEAKRDGRRAAGAVVGSSEAFGWEDGLNLTLNGGNAGLEDDTYFVGAVAGYKWGVGSDLVFGFIHGGSIKAGFGSDTTMDEMAVTVGGTINFGSF